MALVNYVDGVLAVGGFVVFIFIVIMLLLGKWNDKSLLTQVWDRFFNWDIHLGTLGQEEREKRERQEKTRARKPGRLTDFE